MKTQNKQTLSEEEYKGIYDNFVLLKKGEPAWDVMVIKDIDTFNNHIEDLIEKKLEEQRDEINEFYELFDYLYNQPSTIVRIKDEYIQKSSRFFVLRHKLIKSKHK